MDLDKYEQELLKDIENAERFEQVDNYDDVLFETKLAAKNYLKNITVPTTILSALDDPFVESDIFKSVRMSSAIDLNIPDQGGHMGYISSDLTPWGDCRWMDFKVVDWSGEGRE